MKFLPDKLPLINTPDPVFSVLNQYQKDLAANLSQPLINATLGSLYDETGKMFIYQTYYQQYQALTLEQHAAYAADLIGNPDFLTAIKTWLLPPELTLFNHVCATPGGTGAIAAALSTFANPTEVVLIPDIGWPSYRLICQIHQLEPLTYQMFNTENEFDLTSLKHQILALSKKQQRLSLIINDPCHNPTGYCLRVPEWKELIDFLNSLTSTTINLINDVAYIDYQENHSRSREYLKTFQTVKPHILVNLAVSLSKTMTAYGQRLGALITLHTNQVVVDDQALAIVNYARGTWSNTNNPSMLAFTALINQQAPKYSAENQMAISLLKKRSALFLREANDCDLKLYPYQAGFFITIQVKDEQLKNAFHLALLKLYIYTVSVPFGIRIAICGLKLSEIKGLAYRLKSILTSLE